MGQHDGARICAGDIVMDASLPVLAHGGIWQRGFICRSEQTGLCVNAVEAGRVLKDEALQQQP